MKRIYQHFDRFEVYKVFHLLEDAGVPCFVKNELLQGAIGDVPPQNSEPEVWINDNSWFDKASQMIKEFETEQAQTLKRHSAQWVCSNCKEDNEQTFAVCWNCQQSS